MLPFGVDAGEGPSDSLVRAAQVSLGSLGILTSVTLQLEEAHDLHRPNWRTHIDWVLEHFDELVRSHRSVDFYRYPRSDLAQVSCVCSTWSGRTSRLSDGSWTPMASF